MEKFFTALFEFLNKHEFNFIISCLFACITIFILYKTKYPYIFNLWETQEGKIKFSLFICTLVFFFLILCIWVVKANTFIKNKQQKNQKVNNAINTLKMMLDNKTTYKEELCILKILANKKISKFDIDTMIKIIQEVNPDLSREGLWDDLEDSLSKLIKLEIINMHKRYFYSFDEEIFEKVIEEMKSGYSK